MTGMIILYVAAWIVLFIMAAENVNQKKEIAKLSLEIQSGLELAKMELDIRVDIAKEQLTKKNKQKEGAKDDR